MTPAISDRPPVILITGAGGGIGAALAQRLALQGARLALHGRGEPAAACDALAQLRVACMDLGAADCMVVHAVLGSEESARAIIAKVEAHFGALDQLVSNAGYARAVPLVDLSWADMAHAFAVMPMTFAALVRYALPLLHASRQGRVVAVSSFVAHRFEAAHPFSTAAAAKSALEAMVKSFATQLASSAITVNAIAPGFTRRAGGAHHANAKAWEEATARTPLGKIAEPEQIAASIGFLLSDAAAHLTGQIVQVDGGLTL